MTIVVFIVLASLCDAQDVSIAGQAVDRDENAGMTDHVGTLDSGWTRETIGTREAEPVHCPEPINYFPIFAKHIMYRFQLSLPAIVLLFCALTTPNSFGDVRLPAVLDSHMVVQRGTPVQVWGWAASPFQTNNWTKPDVQESKTPAAISDPKQPAKVKTNVSYGPHGANVLDFWQAKGEGPRPLLVYIHGGGWTGGDKKRTEKQVQPYLDKGISYAAINYRLSGDAPLPAPVHDAARAIQFLRSKATEWNIDKSRIALTGGSAGACTSMWILLHDDLADPNSEDPILRESTRVRAAAVAGGQTSIDPKVIEGWLGPNVLKHKMINMAVGEETIEGAIENYDKYHELYVEFSPYNHLDGNDPPLFMSYGNNMKLPSESAGHGIHHPVYGLKMKEKADLEGHECHLVIKNVSQSEKYATAKEFLMSKLLGR